MLGTVPRRTFFSICSCLPLQFSLDALFPDGWLLFAAAIFLKAQVFKIVLRHQVPGAEMRQQLQKKEDGIRDDGYHLPFHSAAQV